MDFVSSAMLASCTNDKMKMSSDEFCQGSASTTISGSVSGEDTSSSSSLTKKRITLKTRHEMRSAGVGTSCFQTMTGLSRSAATTPPGSTRASTFLAPMLCNLIIRSRFPAGLKSLSNSSRPVGASSKRNSSSCKPRKVEADHAGRGESKYAPVLSRQNRSDMPEKRGEPTARR